VAFEYNALGRRIETVDASAGTTTRYYYDDQRVAVQTLVSGGVETDDRYFVFGNYIDETLLMHAGAADLYYAHDHLYSPVALFAANGTVAERYEYDAYGSVQILTSNFSPLTSSQHGNPYAFTGRERDTLDAGSRTLMYYRARTYDPETGRFMQRDPIGYIDGNNLYQYVESQVMIAVDPSGLILFPIITRPPNTAFPYPGAGNEKAPHTVAFSIGHSGSVLLFAAPTPIPGVGVTISANYSTSLFECCNNGTVETWGELGAGIEGKITAGAGFKGKVPATNSKGSKYRDANTGRYAKGPKSGDKDGGVGGFVENLSACPKKGCGGYVDATLYAAVGAGVGVSGTLTYHILPATSRGWEGRAGVEWSIVSAELSLSVEGGLVCYGRVGEIVNFSSLFRREENAKEPKIPQIGTPSIIVFPKQYPANII